MKPTSSRSLGRFACTLLALLALLAMSSAGTSAQTPTGNTYVSEQFGYTIAWPEPWTMTTTGSEAGGYDMVMLEHGDATATIIISRPGDTPLSEIVEFMIDGPDSDETFVPGMVETDITGKPIQGETDDRAWAAYAGNLAGEDVDGFTQFRYGEVRRLESDLGVGLSLAMPAGSFDGSVDAFSALLDGVLSATAAPGTAVATPESANLIFDPNVTTQDRELIAESVQLAEDFFAASFGIAMGTEVTVSALTIASPQDAYLIAATYGTSIVIYAQSLGWLESPPAERIRTVVHEYTHAYQYWKTAGRPLTSAAWFEEGAAEYLSMIAVSDLGLMDRDAMEGYFGSVVTYTELPALHELEPYDALQQQSGQVYPLVYFGIDQLMQALPLTAIDEYYSLLNQGASFALAFEDAFEIAPAAFYDAFAQFRAIGLPVMQDFPDELEIVEGVDLPSQVTAERVPLMVIAGEQSLIVAEAEPGANCTLDLMVAESSVFGASRATFTNGAGQVFWLVTIPKDLPTGRAAVALDCGSDPLVAPVLVS